MILFLLSSFPFFFPSFVLSLGLFSLNFFSFLFPYFINASRRWKVTTDSGVLISFPPSSRSPIKEERKKKKKRKEFLIVWVLIHVHTLSNLSLSVAECPVRFFSLPNTLPRKKRNRYCCAHSSADGNNDIRNNSNNEFQFQFQFQFLI